MSTMTASTNLEARVDELENESGYVETFRHEDGSITVIMYDAEPAESPRDWGTLACLVQESRDYIDLDVVDGGLEEARDRFGIYGHRGAQRVGYLGDYFADQSAKAAGARIAIGKRYGRDDLMQRYIRMFRQGQTVNGVERVSVPSDIVHYEDEWSVGRGGGPYGWGYVTVEAYKETGHSAHPRSREAARIAKEIFDAEVKVYGQYIDGEVYGAIHLSQGDPIVQFGEFGAYVDDYRVDEDSCWGFLGYEKLEDICQQFTDSPVTS